MAKRQYRSYTDEYRREAVDYVLNSGKSIVECAGDLGVNAKTLNDWVIKSERRGEVTARRTDEQLEIDRLKRENERLSKENEFLKKAAAFFASDRARAGGTSSWRRRGTGST